MWRLLPLLLASAPALAAPAFTGHVPADFGPDAILLPDPQGIDVGIPMAFPPGTISGWDIEDIRLEYDAATDTLYVGITTYGIAGDADGDGDPSRTRPELAGIGGVDEPLFGGTELSHPLIPRWS